jgi:hypothetical protein
MSEHLKPGQLYRWEWCWCPRCRGQHLDLVSWDQRAGATPTRQICEGCFLDKLTPQVRETCLRRRAAVAPPVELKEPPKPAVQPSLFCGGDDPVTRGG